MRSIIIFIIIILGWIVLNKWILPKFGISTWMSESCSLEETTKKNQKEK